MTLKKANITSYIGNLFLVVSIFTQYIFIHHFMFFPTIIF